MAQTIHCDGCGTDKNVTRSGFYDLCPRCERGLRADHQRRAAAVREQGVYPAGTKAVLRFYKAHHGVHAETVEEASAWYAKVHADKEAAVIKRDKERKVARIKLRFPWLENWPTVQAASFGDIPAPFTAAAPAFQQQQYQEYSAPQFSDCPSDPETKILIASLPSSGSRPQNPDARSCCTYHSTDFGIDSR